MAFREQGCLLEARTADLEKLRQREKFKEETLKDLLKKSHSCTESSSVVGESESLEIREHQSKE